ncbi:MAG: hypothetical protein PVF76_16110 [Syntrophobacterales bacterium]|jgi:glucose/arabinose dehydrogenase
MNSKRVAFLLIPLIVLTLFSHINAGVEWDVVKTFKLEKRPLDVAVSADGRWLYVLTEQGNIHIYRDGALKGKIGVGKQVDGIDVGPRGDILFLTSKKDKVVQLVTVDLVQEINISGSPFKGSANAPVVIAVFSDFQ